MKKRFLALLTALSSMAMAAEAVVWNEDGYGIMKPADEYTYGSKVNSETNKVKTLSYTVSTANKEGGAGYGFNWRQDDEYQPMPISLADYKGACLTYKATNPFRVDFRQFDVADGNYHGMELAAASSFKKFFIDFSNLKQESWGTTVSWDVELQMGAQFSYKPEMAKKYGTTNKVEIAAFVLADECVTFAPELKDKYKSETTQTVELKETGKLKYKMSEMFMDPDGDDLTITVNIENIDAGAVSLENNGTSFGLSDELVFVPKKNLNSAAIITITAKDPTNKSVFYTVEVTTKDEENPPTAVDDAFEIFEDRELVVDYEHSILINDYDIDGDLFTMKKVSDPLHGTLELDASEGSFIYKPDSAFVGVDSWKYIVKEKKTDGLVSDTATVKITVKAVNKPPVVVVKDSSFIQDTIKVDEDFADTITVKIRDNIEFTDPNNDKLSYGVKTNGRLNASLVTVGGNFYVKLSSVKNAFGLAIVTVWAKDQEGLSASVSFFVDIAPVMDPAVVVNDAYEVNERDTLVVNANEGVLANDTIDALSPDTAVSAVLVKKPANGSAELGKDGSLKYIPKEGFIGKDTLTYHVVIDEDVSKDASVIITVLNVDDSPVVAVDTATLDTTVEQNFKTAIVFKNTVFTKWFNDPDGDSLTYTAKSDDDKLKVTMTASQLTIASVKDSVGDAYVSVTATDAGEHSATLRIHVKIKPKNNAPKPNVAEDTVSIDTAFAWPHKYDLKKIFTDKDQGDTLTFGINFVHALLTAEINGDTLVVNAENPEKLKKGVPYRVIIVAKDLAGDSATAKVVFQIPSEAASTPDKPSNPDAIKSIVSAPKTWQNAVAATRGTAAILDMQGRIMWTKALPASESEVRAVMQKNSGNAILRVNNQTWMLNKKAIK